MAHLVSAVLPYIIISTRLILHESFPSCSNTVVPTWTLEKSFPSGPELRHQGDLVWCAKSDLGGSVAARTKRKNLCFSRFFR
jgi:hypothetical protein